MRFLQERREPTRVSGSQPSPKRFLATSISHEGDSTHTHSDWDDCFAIKGWLADDGLSVRALPAASGPLTMAAKQSD